MRRVVVTAYGAISPVGKTAGETWESLMQGKSGIRKVSLFDASPYPCQIAGEISDFDPSKYLDPKEARRNDRFIQFCLAATQEASNHSGIDWAKIDPTRAGACIGVGMGGLITIEEQHNEILQRGPKRVSPFFIPMIIPNLAAGQVAIKFKLQGPNICTTTACSSSAHAIGEAFKMIQRGDVDLMVTGGAEAVICVLGFAGFCAARALSTRNDEPHRASRPWDKDRDGFVMGEGSSILFLEELEHAKKRGAKIVAEVLGYAANCDANHITQPTPGGEGPSDCMNKALADAKLDKTQIEYVNAHGTSTPLGDISETKALKRTFGDHAKKLWVSSTKSMTGHLLGAAGSLEAMFCAQAIEKGVVPPTVNLENPDPECDLDYVPNEARQRKLKYVMTNSFGFGGTNATIILGQYN